MQVITMAYFLKKTKNKKGLYLQIYESFYDPNRGHTAHKSYRSLGYEADLIESGIKNPLDHFQLEVDELNRKLNLKKSKETFGITGIKKGGELFNTFIWTIR